MISLTAFTGVLAIVKLLDFETPAEAIPSSGYFTGGATATVSTAWASSGRSSLHFVNPKWKQKSDKPTHWCFKPSVKCFEGYKRLVFDTYVAKTTEKHASFTMYLMMKGMKRGDPGPRLMVQLPTHGFSRHVVVLEDTVMHPFEELSISLSRPLEELDVFIDNIMLLKNGEEVPEAGFPISEILRLDGSLKKVSLENERLTDELGHLRDYLSFVQSSNVRCGEVDMAVGFVSSMERVRPRESLGAKVSPATKGAKMRLAKNEFESMQVVIAANGKDLKNVEVKVEFDDAPRGVAFTSAPVGYVEAKSKPFFKPFGSSGSGVGWWPDPILDYRHTADVTGFDVQSFWVRAHASKDATTGVYRGKIAVTADNCAKVTFPFEIKVDPFVLPDAPGDFPLAVTFSPQTSETVLTRDEIDAIAKDPESPICTYRANREKWTDFLIDYGITRDSFYEGGVAYPSAIEYLQKQGRLGYFNLGYWSPEEGEAAVPRLRKNYEWAKQRGILDRAYIYGCDEAPASTLPQVQKTLEVLKREFSDVPVMTTAFDSEFGCGTPLSKVDMFCPLTRAYHPDQVAKARAENRKVWWYICCIPEPPYANALLESAAIELRLLMGAMTAKYRPDGFLYYETAMWNSRKILGDKVFTDWEARSFSSYHGDGCWVYIGPKGVPVASIRLENFRDGLEDLAYTKLLAGLGGAAEVPSELVKDLREYSHDPERLYQWREQMADEIIRRMKTK